MSLTILSLRANVMDASTQQTPIKWSSDVDSDVESVMMM